MGMIEVNWKPPAAQLRNFGLICLVAFGAIGGWIYWRSGILGITISPPTAVTIAYVLWTLAALCGLAALIKPAVVWPVYVVLTAVSLPIGLVVSNVIIAIMYYGILTPIGLVMRLAGRDPMNRRFDPNASTYWVKRPPISDVKRYFHQY